MIDYALLDSSCSYYANQGFERMEVPWWVTMEAMKVTTPTHISDESQYYLPSNGLCLVASAEQSFIELAKQGQLPRGRFFAITPCFRNDEVDETHHKYFVKNELIDTHKVCDISLHNMIDVAYDFFKEHVPDFTKLTFEHTEEGVDICYNGIELGSYGIRSCRYLDWVYGTGCAEPRLSYARTQ